MSKPIDATAKDLLEFDPAAWLDYLHLRPQGLVRVIDSDLSTVTTEADKVLRIDGPAPWLVHVELQAARDPRFVRRVLRYYVLLNVRHDLPVLSVVILLRPAAEAPDLTGVWEQQLPDGLVSLTFRYRVVRTWEQPVEEVLAGGLGTLPLAPLAVKTPEDLPAVVRRLGERLRDEAGPEESARIWTATAMLMGLRYPPNLIEHVLLGVRDMVLGIHGIEESSVYQAILARGRAEGEAIGKTEGRAEGRIEGERQVLLRMGQKRFGPPPAEIRAEIEALTDPERVAQLAERLLDVASWEELMAGT